METRATMVFDDDVREVDDPYGAERMAWVEAAKSRHVT